MALVTVRTAKISGGGSITCRRCDRKTMFAGDEWLELLDTGRTFAVLAVKDGLVALHDCRRASLVWQCPSCGERPDVKLRGRRGERQWFSRMCRKCGTELRQVRDVGREDGRDG